LRKGVAVNRLDIGYFLLGSLTVAIVAVVYLSQRYSRYLRAVRHGQRNAKPVWKPFWMQ